jgi:hypothetical protein
MDSELGDDGTFANKHGEWPFVDWSPAFDGDSPQARAATTCFMVYAGKEAVFLLNELGDQTSAQKWQGWTDRLEAAARQHLAGDLGTYGDRRQENAMAVYSGVATGQQDLDIYDHVLNPSSPSWQQVVSPYYNNYVLFALSDLGHTQDAVNFIRSFWGGMLAEGATSTWEGYDLSWDKHNFHSHLQADDGTGYFVSLAHGWSSGATSLLTERVLGIRPTGAGFKTCLIAPDLGDLQWVSGAVPTPDGVIRARFERVGTGMTAKIHVPTGVVATLKIAGSISHLPSKVTFDAAGTKLTPGDYSLSIGP